MTAIGRQERLVGIIVWVCGYELILTMVPPEGREILGRKVIYRPMELYVTGPQYEKSVVLCWEQTADQGTIHIRLSRLTWDSEPWDAAGNIYTTMLPEPTEEE